MSADGHRLVVLTSADGGADTEVLRSSLQSWARAGLLGRVAWAEAADLASLGGRAPCEIAAERNWLSASLESVTGRGVSELWLAALRGRNAASDQARRTEDKACAALRRLFGDGVTFRSLTMTVAGPDRPFSHADFSAMWDFHLLHDRHVTPAKRVARRDACETATLALSAVVALCAAAGWREAEGGLKLVDRASGPIKHPRLVHAQVRALHATDYASLGTPESPPWPAPGAAGVRLAAPGSMPPAHMADQLIKQCRFDCERPRLTLNEARYPTGLWGRLFGRMSEPLPWSQGELALGRLAQRTDGYKSHLSDGTVPLALSGATAPDDVDDLVEHVKQSNFPIGARSAGAMGSTPETWETVRGTLLGLIDGEDLPSGVSPVIVGDGHDGERLVWSDPAALAPPHAPVAGAEPPQESRLASSRVLNDLDGDDPEAHETQDQTGQAHSVTDDEALFRPPPAATSVRSEPQPPLRADDQQGDSVGPTDSVTTPEPPEAAARIVASLPPKEHAVVWSEEADDGSSGDEWRRLAEDALPSGGYHDTLMSRLGASLDRGVERARTSFIRYSAIRPPQDEHSDALRARKRARYILAAGTLLLLLVAAAAVDQRWPYLAVTWEAATPWRAQTIYGPTLWPVGWFVVGAVVVVVFALVFTRSARRLGRSVQALAEYEERRFKLTAGSTHFAGELLRLHTLRQQFGDHRLIITEVLHRPFGDPSRADRGRLEMAALRQDGAVPASMLVGASNPADHRVEIEQKRLQERLTQRGWLTAAYHDILRAWRDDYERRVVGAFPQPDEDISPRGTTAFWDQREGREVPGAREDLADAVARDGWAVREAVGNRWLHTLAASAGGDDAQLTMDRYLELLDAPASVHGPVEATDSAAEFLDLGPCAEDLAPDQVSHRFSWAEMLSPAAAGSAPRLRAFGPGAPWTAGSDAAAGTVVLMASRCEYSDQIPADHLRGWHAERDHNEPASTGGVI